MPDNDTQQPIKPLDPNSPKGKRIAAALSEVIADVEHQVAARKAAERRKAGDAERK